MVSHVVVGSNQATGETRQLVVGTGVWKRSQLLPEDLSKPRSLAERDAVNCLITEIVVPGFDWRDHEYLTQRGLEDIFEGSEENIARHAQYIKPLNNVH